MGILCIICWSSLCCVSFIQWVLSSKGGRFGGWLLFSGIVSPPLRYWCWSLHCIWCDSLYCAVLMAADEAILYVVDWGLISKMNSRCFLRLNYFANSWYKSTFGHLLLVPTGRWPKRVRSLFESNCETPQWDEIVLLKSWIWSHCASTNFQKFAFWHSAHALVCASSDSVPRLHLDCNRRLQSHFPCSINPAWWREQREQTLKKFHSRITVAFSSVLRRDSDMAPRDATASRRGAVAFN